MAAYELSVTNCPVRSVRGRPTSSTTVTGSIGIIRTGDSLFVPE